MKDYYSEVYNYCEANVVNCKECKDLSGKPILTSNTAISNFSLSAPVLPFVGPKYGESTTLVFLGLEDPWVKDQAKSMDELRDYLINNLKKNDWHRIGERFFAQDLLSHMGISFAELENPFHFVATLNNHLCTLKDRTETTHSKSYLLKNKCRHSWEIIKILEPEILVVESRQIWDNIKKELEQMGGNLTEIERKTGSKGAGSGSLNVIDSVLHKIFVFLVTHPSHRWTAKTKRYYLPVIKPLIEKCVTLLSSKNKLTDNL
jgi:hypothetical protein